MKRYKILRALAAALCILAATLVPIGEARFPFMPAARAEERADLLHISLTARPDALVEPGDVTLSLVIENPSAYDAQNVYLSSSDGLLSEPIGQIAAGQSQTLTRPHSVSQAELDAGAISYIISHDDPFTEGNKVNYTVQAEIHQSDLQPEVEFTRQFSSRYVTTGSTVTITYRIRNTGNVVLTGLQVQDELGDYTGRVEQLDVGESRTLISRVTLTEADASRAALSYNVEATGEENKVITLAEAPIRIAYGQIDGELSVSYSAFSTSTAEVVLLLTNLGNVDYTNIRITDDIYGGVIADNLTLPSGNADPVAISSSYPVRGDDGFRWRITGDSEAGDSVDFVTDTVYLTPREIVFPAEVTMRIEALTPAIRRAGEVPMRVRIENAGDADVTNIVLNEAFLGDVHSFAIIPAGGSIERDISFQVDETKDFYFSIRYTDATGWERSLAVPPVSVEISADGVLPEGVTERFFEFTGDSIKIGGSSMFAVLLIVGGAVLLILIITLLIASRRARMEKRLRMVAERQRRKEGGKAAPARDGKKPKAKK